MDRKIFFDSLRDSGAFGKKLQSNFVKGVDAILDGCIRWHVVPLHHTANIMAQSHHETGGQMEPVKETVYAHSEDRNPSDAEVIRRLDRAFAKGQLSWVSKPYWRDGWFGRGLVQITHEKNYIKLGTAIGVDLVKNRDLALDLTTAVDIAVVGMTRGLFTGKKLGDYNFPDALKAKPALNPRRIINGEDGTDAKIAKMHIFFYDALVKAGYNAEASCRAPSL